MIEFLDVKRINARFTEAFQTRLGDVIQSGRYLLGDQLAAFERNLASYLGTNYALGTGSGLDALRLILQGYKELGYMEDGDEVIVPANTFIASVLAITANGLKPVFAEPETRSFNLDVSVLEPLITGRTRAIMVVHLYGQVCWQPELERLARRYDLKIIEDAAQAIGARCGERRAGGLGDAGAFSFYPGKNLGALGDGGAVTTDDARLADVVGALRNYGSRARYVHDFQGSNSRLDEMQAAMLDVKLGFLDADNQHRRWVASRYLQEISNPLLELPVPARGGEPQSHVWHLFVLRCAHRDALRTYLENEGIASLIHYPIPPHKQAAFHGLVDVRLPVTERLAREVVSIPISQVLSEQDVDSVVKALNGFQL